MKNFIGPYFVLSQKTQIAVLINQLRKNSKGDVAQLASDIVKDWRNLAARESIGEYL